jgi:hypothetical protein
MAQISNNFYDQPAAMAEARRIASERRGTVYLVQDMDAPGRPWSVHAVAPVNQPSMPVLPE